MLIAEELLLLLTDQDSGKLVKSESEVDAALGGALLVELSLDGRVDVAGAGERVKEGRLVVRDDSETGDPVLDKALEILSEKQGKKPKDAIDPLQKKLRTTLYERLAGKGILRLEKSKILGLFTVRRWPAVLVSPRQEARARLRGLLVDGWTPEPRSAAVASLVHAIGAVPKIVSPDEAGLSKKELEQRAKTVTEGDWCSEAVRKAISEAAAAAIAAATTVAVASGSS